MHQREKLILIQCHCFQIHQHAATCPQKGIHCRCPRMICHQRENKRASSAILFFINSPFFPLPSYPSSIADAVPHLSPKSFILSLLFSPSCPMSKLSPLFLASCQVASSRWVELHSWQRLSKLSQCRHCAQTSRTHSRERKKTQAPVLSIGQSWSRAYQALLEQRNEEPIFTSTVLSKCTYQRQSTLHGSCFQMSNGYACVQESSKLE